MDLCVLGVLSVGRVNWNDIISDAVGNYLYAVVDGGYIYVSRDFGRDDSWVIADPSLSGKHTSLATFTVYRKLFYNI